MVRQAANTQGGMTSKGPAGMPGGFPMTPPDTPVRAGDDPMRTPGRTRKQQAPYSPVASPGRPSTGTAAGDAVAARPLPGPTDESPGRPSRGAQGQQGQQGQQSMGSFRYAPPPPPCWPAF